MIVLGLQGDDVHLVSSEGLGRKSLNIKTKNITKVYINPNGRSAFFKTLDKISFLWNFNRVFTIKTRRTEVFRHNGFNR